MQQREFSRELQAWAKGSSQKTLGGLTKEFSCDAFAIIILLLMAIPALPVPTGGLTHVFEIITMLLALELVAGRTTIWLPKKWRSKSLDNFAKGKTLAKLVSIIHWFEGFSRPRGMQLIGSRYFLSVAGLFILVFTLAAFLAPPFSGLDTLPSLGVVIISLSLILSDILFFIAGIAMGAVGITVTLLLGTALYHLF